MAHTAAEIVDVVFPRAKLLPPDERAALIQLTIDVAQGRSGDDPGRLVEAAEYLEAHIGNNWWAGLYALGVRDDPLSPLERAWCESAPGRAAAWLAHWLSRRTSRHGD